MLNVAWILYVTQGVPLAALFIETWNHFLGILPTFAVPGKCSSIFLPAVSPFSCTEASHCFQRSYSLSLAFKTGFIYLPAPRSLITNCECLVPVMSEIEKLVELQQQIHYFINAKCDVGCWVMPINTYSAENIRDQDTV